MKVYCDNCDNQFEFKIHKKKVAEGIFEYYTECPECKKQYHSYYENKKIKKIIDKNREISKTIKGYDTLEESAKILKKFQDNKKQIEAEQKKIQKELDEIEKK